MHGTTVCVWALYTSLDFQVSTIAIIVVADSGNGSGREWEWRRWSKVGKETGMRCLTRNGSEWE